MHNTLYIQKSLYMEWTVYACICSFNHAYLKAKTNNPKFSWRSRGVMNLIANTICFCKDISSTIANPLSRMIFFTECLLLSLTIKVTKCRTHRLSFTNVACPDLLTLPGCNEVPPTAPKVPHRWRLHQWCLHRHQRFVAKDGCQQSMIEHWQRQTTIDPNCLQVPRFYQIQGLEIYEKISLTPGKVQ